MSLSMNHFYEFCVLMSSSELKVIVNTNREDDEKVRTVRGRERESEGEREKDKMKRDRLRQNKRFGSQEHLDI